MKPLPVLTVAFAVAHGTLCVSAEDVPAHALSMTQAVAMAVQVSGSIAAESEGIHVAVGMAEVAASLMYPSLQTRILQRRDDDGDGAGELAAQLAVTQPIYRGGRVRAAMDEAHHFEALSQSRVVRSLQATKHDARLAYCRLLLGQRLETVSATQVDIARQFLATTRERLSRSLVGEREVLRAEVELANQQAALLRSQYDVNARRVQLCRLVGLSGRTDICLVDQLDRLDAALPPVSTDMDVLLVARPEIREARLASLARAYTISALRAQRGPELHVQGRLEGGLAWDGDMDEQWQIALTMDLPFLQSRDITGRVRQEEALLRRDEYLSRERERDIRAIIETALVQQESAATQAAHLTATIAKAQRYLEGEHERLALGSATYLDVLNARRTLAQLQRDRYRALYDRAIARIELLVSQNL